MVHQKVQGKEVVGGFKRYSRNPCLFRVQGYVVWSSIMQGLDVSFLYFHARKPSLGYQVPGFQTWAGAASANSIAGCNMI